MQSLNTACVVEESDVLEGLTSYWTERSESYSAQNVEEMNNWKRDAWRDLILRYAPRKKKLRILDVGTGPGFFAMTLALAGHEVVAIDVTEQMLEHARENARVYGANVKFLLQRGENLPCPDESFDLIVSRNVIWNLEFPECAFREWERVLAPGGRMVYFDANWYLYLFDEEMLHQATNVWKLQSVNISVDGMEENYNRIKSYNNPKDNPFQRVMRNIGLFLSREIFVNLRMNFDMGNHSDFKSLLQYVKNKFGDSPFLNVYAHQISGEFSDDLLHGDEEWFSGKIVELNDLAREAGMYRRSIKLPSLVSIGCKAAMDSTVTITPEGFLVRCPEQFGADQITGNVKDGITNIELIKSWKRLCNDGKCNECNMFPRCLRIMNCSVGDRCCYKEEYNILCKEAIIRTVVGSKQYDM